MVQGNIRSRAALVLILVVVAALTACRTAPVVIGPELTRAELFQRAQEAFDQDRYEVALQYYNAVVERFADQPGVRAEAEYEIAFIAYKQEEYEQALALFQALLERYRSEPEGSLPEWPRVLSVRLVETIEDRLASPGRRDRR